MSNKLVLALVLSVAVWSGHAQESLLIEEIIVTAQKREQDIQDVSIAVTALSGELMEELGLQAGLDITAQVPNMSFFGVFGEASSPSMTLRGISLVNFADTWEAPVGLHIDEVYRGNPSGTAIQLFDVQRIEVLRGPQGTLFGRNTTGGLVHHVTNNPTDDFEFGVDLQAGSYNELVVQAVISGPIGERVRGRLAVKKNDNDGWQVNGVDGSDVGTTDTLGYRAKLEFDITERSTLLLDVHGSRADQQSVGFFNLGYQDPADPSLRCSPQRILAGECVSLEINDGFAAARPSRVEADGWGPKHVSSSASDGMKTEIDTFGVSAKYVFGFDDFDITSITALERMDKFLEDDFDATAVYFFDEQYLADTEQFTQEIRLSGSAQNLNWVAGFYYIRDDRDLVTQNPTTDDANANVFGGFWHNEFIVQETRSSAVFGQVEYSLSDTLVLAAGGRYTSEEKKADFSNRGLTFYWGAVTLSDELDESGLSGRLGLDYKPDEDTLYYATLSRGLKSGGYNGSYVPDAGAFGPVTREVMTSLEGGYKRTFSDGRGRFNAAAFAYKLKDFQAQLWDTSIGAANVINLGDVDGQGLEAELTYAVSDGFELIAGASFLNTEIDSDLVTTVAGVDIPIDGNEMPTSPGFTYNFIARYSVANWTGQLSYSWQDDYELQLENDPWSQQESYGIANAMIRWVSDGGNLAVQAGANNLFDEEYFTYLNTGGSDWGYGIWGSPRTAYVRLSYSFD